jgi:hypothetical protein
MAFAYESIMCSSIRTLAALTELLGGKLGANKRRHLSHV